jgi:hypothetical protein
MMKTFEDETLGDAFDEMIALGPEFSAKMLGHCHRVDSRQIDHRGLLVFATYKGVEMFLAQIGANFIVYAVELDAQNDLTLTIMFAGQHGRPTTAGLHSWDGTNYAKLASGIIQARAAAHFR